MIPDSSKQDGTIASGSIHVIEEVLNDAVNIDSTNYIHLLDFKKNIAQTKDRCNFFYVMSKIINGNEVYHGMIRLFFYFFYKSLSQLHSEHPFFLRIMPEFSKKIIERTYVESEESRYGASLIIEDIGLLPSDSSQLYDEANKVKPEYYSLLLKLLSDSFLKSKFTGDMHDILVLATINNIEICILEAVTKDSASVDINYIREWELSFTVAKAINDFMLPVPMQESTTKWITKIDNLNYAVLTTENKQLAQRIIDYPSYDGEHYIINPRNILTENLLTDSAEKTQLSVEDNFTDLIEEIGKTQLNVGIEQAFDNFISQRKFNGKLNEYSKLLDIAGGKINNEDPDYLSVGPMFTFNDFIHAKVDPTLIVPIIRILDPWKQLVDANVFPINNLHTFRDLMTYRPRTWLRDQALLGFIKWLNYSPEMSREYFCIDPATYKNIISKRSRIDSFLKNHGIKLPVIGHLKKLLMLLYHDNHYIVVEVDIPKKQIKDQVITCLIADPLNQSLEHLIEVLEEEHVELLVDAIFPKKEIIYIKATNVALQQNSYDCGIMCLQRMFMWKKYQTTLINSEIPEYNILTNTDYFRLYALSKIIEDNMEQLSCFIMKTEEPKNEMICVANQNIIHNLDLDSNESADNYYTREFEETITTDNENCSSKDGSNATNKGVHLKSLSGKNIIIEATAIDEKEISSKQAGGKPIVSDFKNPTNQDNSEDDDDTLSYDKNMKKDDSSISNKEESDDVLDSDDEIILSHLKSKAMKTKSKAQTKSSLVHISTSTPAASNPPTNSKQALSKHVARKRKIDSNIYNPPKRPRRNADPYVGSALNSKTAREIDRRKRLYKKRKNRTQ